MKSTSIKPVACLLLLCAAGRFANAEETLASMQQTFVAKCAESGQKQQASASTINRLCGCMWQAMQDNLSVDEIQQLMVLDTPDKQAFLQAAPARKILQPWQACAQKTFKSDQP